MKSKTAVFSILAAGILAAALVVALPVGLAKSEKPEAPSADHSLFDTQTGDTSVTCTSTKEFAFSASVTNFDSTRHAVTVKFLGPGGPDLVTYFVAAGQSLTISGFGRGTQIPDESNIIRVVPDPVTTATPIVGWVSIFSDEGSPSCFTSTTLS